MPQFDYSIEFGKRLAEIVGDRPKLQIANDLNCSDVTVRYWLKGKIPFAIYMLKSLRDVYGVDLNELITGDEDGQNKSRDHPSNERGAN